MSFSRYQLMGKLQSGGIQEGQQALLDLPLFGLPAGADPTTEIASRSSLFILSAQTMRKRQRNIVSLRLQMASSICALELW